MAEICDQYLASGTVIPHLVKVRRQVMKDILWPETIFPCHAKNQSSPEALLRGLPAMTSGGT